MYLALTIGVNLAIGAGVVLLIRYARKNPHVSREDPEIQRMPRFVPYLAWPVTAVGAGLILLAFAGSTDPRDILPMQAGGAVIFLAGGYLVLLYRNFYVRVTKTEIETAGVLGSVRRIAFRDLESLATYTQNRHRMIKIRGIDGTRIKLSSTIYDVQYLLAYVWEHGTRTQPAPARR